LGKALAVSLKNPKGRPSTESGKRSVYAKWQCFTLGRLFVSGTVKEAEFEGKQRKNTPKTQKKGTTWKVEMIGLEKFRAKRKILSRQVSREAGYKL